MEGWPDKFHLHDAIKPYWAVRGELSVVYGLLLKASRIMVPSTMRLQVPDKVHEGHQGIVKSCKRAKTSVWWPGLSCKVSTWSRTAKSVPNIDNKGQSHSSRHPFLNAHGK